MFTMQRPTDSQTVHEQPDARQMRHNSSEQRYVLRVGITDRCNLRCAYCMPSTGLPRVGRDRLPDLGELADLVAWIDRTFPVEHIKVTGGEPLVRTGVVDFVRRVAEMPRRPEISMTTNGTLLADLAEELRLAGLTRVNVSLDTLDQERYRRLTRGGRLEQVLDGLSAARDAGFSPIKINAVLRRSSHRKEVPALLDYAAEQGFELRFLELMRSGTERAWCAREFLAADEVLRWLARRRGCSLLHTRELSAWGSSPARKGWIRWRGKDLNVGWILPVSLPFCDTCNRLRLDAGGRLRRCLMDLEGYPLREALATDGDVAARAGLTRYIAGKRPPTEMSTDLPMVKLGG
jgi:cyclic pyranopterin phosphate synthase